jgi:large subunit ribosomal protein L9
MRIEEVRVRKDKRLAEDMAQRLSSVSCTIRMQADEHDKLYGAVHERDVAQALADQGIEIDPHSVVLEEPLKMLGVYPVKLHLFKGVEAEIKVWVIRE